MNAVLIALIAAIPPTIAAIGAYAKIKRDFAAQLREAQRDDKVDAREYTDRLIERTTADVLRLRKETEELRLRVAKLEAQVNALKPWRSYARALVQILKDNGIDAPPEPIDYFSDDDSRTTGSA